MPKWYGLQGLIIIIIIIINAIHCELFVYFMCHQLLPNQNASY
jgi:hypothetical protein